MAPAAYDLRPLVDRIAAVVEGCAQGAVGAYRRYVGAGISGVRDLATNPYGCADAANILYTVGRFPRDAGVRGAFVSALQGLQDPQSGLFREDTHHPIHTTAHCIAALELFDAGPRHALAQLAPLRDADAMEDFLEALDWAGQPWTAAHEGAGLYAALVLAGEVGPAWQDRYFAWLDAAADPQTGLLRKGCIPALDGPAAFPHLAGTFHYLFNLESARRPLRHPDALVDTCLEIRERGIFPLGRNVWFAEIDWVYCLTRSLRQCGHRFGDARRSLLALAADYVPYLLDLDLERDDGGSDLHRLFGSCCALAELQSALPGTLLSDPPLRLVLDRRPFV